MQCSSWSWHALGFRGETRRSSLAFDLEGTKESLVQKRSGKGFIIVCPLNSNHSESYAFGKRSILFSCFVCLGAKDVCRLVACNSRTVFQTHAALWHGGTRQSLFLPWSWGVGVSKPNVFYSIVAPSGTVFTTCLLV